MNQLQKAINQIGEDAVSKALPRGCGIGRCELHGAYLVMPSQEPCCPTCPATPPANGVTASDVEHYIDVDPAHSLGTNPMQKVNPYGV